MNRIQQFIKYASEHRTTTAIGCAGIAGAIGAAIHNPAIMTTEAWWGGLILSIGFIFSADASKTSTK